MAFAVRSVMVTGASRGIGLEMVRQLVALPSAPEVVIATCRDPTSASNLQEIAKSHASVKVIKLDVEKDEDIENAAKEAKSILGDHGLNILINNAGLNEKAEGNGGIYKVTRERMQRHFDVNCSAPLMVTQELLPLIEKAASLKQSKEANCQAAIVMISSIMGSQDFTYSQGKGVSLHYKCSKTAITMASILLSRELSESGIFVAAQHPGWVKTDMGGSNADLTVEESAAAVLNTIGAASQATNGKLLNPDGSVLPY